MSTSPPLLSDPILGCGCSPANREGYIVLDSLSAELTKDLIQATTNIIRELLPDVHSHTHYEILGLVGLLFHHEISRRLGNVVLGREPTIPEMLADFDCRRPTEREIIASLQRIFGSLQPSAGQARPTKMSDPWSGRAHPVHHQGYPGNAC